MNHFALAKYVPNIRRGEPINVGLFLITPYGTKALFLTEEAWQTKVKILPLPSGELSAVNQERVNIYKEWVRYWERMVTKHGTAANALEELQRYEKHSYYVVEAGKIFDEVQADDVERLTLQLFAELVM